MNGTTAPQSNPIRPERRSKAATWLTYSKQSRKVRLDLQKRLRDHRNGWAA